jgi:hypothetical protein
MTSALLVARITHTGVYSDGRVNSSSILISDGDSGFAQENRKTPLYVPSGGTVEVPLTSNTLYSLNQGSIRGFVDSGQLEVDVVIQIRNDKDFGGTAGTGVSLAGAGNNIERVSGQLRFVLDAADAAGFIPGETVRFAGLTGDFLVINGDCVVSEVTKNTDLAGAAPGFWLIEADSPGADIPAGAQGAANLTLPNGKVVVELSSDSAGGFEGSSFYLGSNAVITGSVDPTAIEFAPAPPSLVAPNAIFVDSTDNTPYFKNAAGSLFSLLGGGGGGGGGVTGSFDKTVYVTVGGDSDPSNDGSDPNNPTTLGNVMTNHQTSSMLVILGIGTHSVPGGISVNEDNVSFISRMGGVHGETTAITGELTLGSGVTRFQAWGLRFNSDIMDDSSDGRHRFLECTSGNIKYTRVNPKNYLEFSDSSMNQMDYKVTGSGSNGTAGGGDTFMSGNSDLGTVQLDTASHYFKTRHGQTTGQIRAGSGVFVFVVLEGTVVNSKTALSVSVPAGMVIAQNCRMNNSSGIGPVEAQLSWLDDCIFDVSASSLGSSSGLGLGAAYFTELSYTAANPGDWSGSAPTTIQQAIDRLAAANPGA